MVKGSLHYPHHKGQGGRNWTRNLAAPVLYRLRAKMTWRTFKFFEFEELKDPESNIPYDKLKVSSVFR